jgi:hypothetical protein
MVIILVKLHLLRPCQSDGANYWCTLASTDESVHKKSSKFSQAENRKNPRNWAKALDILPPTHEEQDDKESAAALQVKAATNECF